MFKCKVKFTRTASEISSKTPHSRYSYFVTIVGHCFSVNIEGSKCYGTPVLEVV